MQRPLGTGPGGRCPLRNAYADYDALAIPATGAQPAPPDPQNAPEGPALEGGVSGLERPIVGALSCQQ